MKAMFRGPKQLDRFRGFGITGSKFNLGFTVSDSRSQIMFDLTLLIWWPFRVILTWYRS